MAAFVRAPHHVLDTRLMIAWAEAGSALPDLFSAIPPQLSLAQRREIVTGRNDSFPPPQARTDPVAVCALVFGVLGLPVCLPIFSIPAIFCARRWTIRSWFWGS